MKRCAKQLRKMYFVPLIGQWPAECACAVSAWQCAAVGRDKGKRSTKCYIQHKGAIAQTRYHQGFQNPSWWETLAFWTVPLQWGHLHRLTERAFAAICPSSAAVSWRYHAPSRESKVYWSSWKGRVDLHLQGVVALRWNLVGTLGL